MPKRFFELNVAARRAEHVREKQCCINAGVGDARFGEGLTGIRQYDGNGGIGGWLLSHRPQFTDGAFRDGANGSGASCPSPT